MVTYSTQSCQPAWLTSLLDDTSPAPKLYAWTPDNIRSSTETKESPSPDSADSADLNRRIFILGIGNLGRLYASCLSMHTPRPPITLVVHKQELLSQWIQGPGLEITRSGRLYRGKDEFQIEWWTEQAPIYGPVREIARGTKVRNLIVATKAAAAMREADRLRRYLDSSSSVAFLQNGMSKLWPPHGQEYVAKRYPQNDAPNFLACVTNHGVLSEGPFKSLHASPADSAIGPVLLNETARHLAPSVGYLTEAIASAPCLNARSITKVQLWVSQLQKLVVNSTINPLTAVLRCKNGALFENPHGAVAKVIDRLLHESSAILQALINHRSTAEILTSSTDVKSAQSLSSLREELYLRFSFTELRSMLYKIGNVVKDNTSSMLQDARAGKPTEIRDFNGWLVETADFLRQSSSGQPRDRDNLDVSCHQALIAMVESGTVVDETELAKQLLP
ncbi:6-phosphogluconate dehydrogenase C-terminal domain-like protein [Trichoderma citrinoviride]|uniref:6-phosphogluconate dehydrogenase C-terminal domain-like protein n=1 Tax=Trichoderma citrinoviride TaxID=58853 RepID=A0A2T4BB70_9HYPO|nr:6-phosphogluconate dehydrogenase C-terminal domain-like protein [Trichoderma citrinoviride]PTB66538.1 6-phosphogluconate dehydrogenase C-terminal domain-like protein [Trichoderma citrinoviride]